MFAVINWSLVAEIKVPEGNWHWPRRVAMHSDRGSHPLEKEKKTQTSFGCPLTVRGMSVFKNCTGLMWVVIGTEPAACWTWLATLSAEPPGYKQASNFGSRVEDSITHHCFATSGWASGYLVDKGSFWKELVPCSSLHLMPQMREIQVSNWPLSS
jgi:hypothetical protein